VSYTEIIDIPSLNVYVQERGKPVLVLLPYCSKDVFQAELSELVAEFQNYETVTTDINSSLSQKLMRCILPACSDGELKSMFTWLIDGGWWEYVGKVLQTVTNAAQRRHVVEQAADRADDSDIIQYILPHCSEEELKSVLPELVSRGLWMSLSELLQNVELRSHVLEQVADCTNPNHVIPVLPHCSDSELDVVLTRRVTKGLWMDVYFGLNDHFNRYDVDAYCRSLPRDFKVYQLPRVCARVRIWLYRDEGREAVTRAVEEASLTAKDSYFARYVLPHCKNQQVISVLNNLVARGAWQSVSEL
jgi:hypothetical protein